MSEEKTGKKVLIVDDNPILTDLFKIAFESKGAIVEIENGSKNVIQKVKDTSPDLILLDLLMPEKDGIEVLKDLKNDEGTKDTRVIILTSSDDNKLKQDAENFGAQGYLMKSNMDVSHIASEVLSSIEKQST